MHASVAHGGLAALMVLVLFVAAPAAGATTYYVDYEGGSDLNSGTSPEAALQRCPGDPQAQGEAASAVLDPGDIVIFKGGVTYRGSIICSAQGTAREPIIYDGNTEGGFGNGRAIVDGSELVGGWKRCESPDDCGGNPNYRSIFYGYVGDIDNPFALNMYDGGDMIWPAQSPNQEDPFYLDNYQDYRIIPDEGATQSTITDPGFFTQKDPHYWDGAYIAILARPMYVYFQRVTGYDPDTGTIRYEALETEHYVETHPGLGCYMMLNSLNILDRSGEYVLSDETDAAGRRKLYFWPRTDSEAASKKISLSRRITAFDVNGRNNLTIRGFLVQKYISKQPHRGAGISNDSEAVSGLVIRDNEIRYCNKDSSWKHAGINLAYATDTLVEGNRIYENRRCGGIYLLGGCRDVLVRDNVIRRDGYQGIWVMGAEDCRVIGNKVIDNEATHSNGISTYSRARNILVFGNMVVNSNAPFTSNTAFDITVAYNIFLDGTVADWGNCRRLSFFNNLMLGGVMINRNSTEVVLRNCIYASPTLGDPVQVDHCIQAQGRRGSARGSTKNATVRLSELFVDAEAHDFRPQPGSPAIDAGVEVGFDRDYAGNRVPQGEAPDIGAIEYTED